jgi:hypothetical protein
VYRNTLLTKNDMIMKKLKIWSILMLMAMSLPLMVSCGGDDDESSAPPSEYPENPDPYDILNFKDIKVAAICVANFDANKDGKITYAEAAAVKDIDVCFRNSDIESFDEFRYFVGLSDIAHNAFRDCSRLVSITIPKYVKSTGKSAFRYCTKLTSITILNGVTAINPYSFEGCSSLVSISIPNSVTTIYYNAFAKCSGLTTVTIGNSVKKIAERVFYDCNSLTYIHCKGAIPPTLNNSFTGGVTFDENTYSSATLYVPQGSAEAYKSAEGWKNFQNIVEE